MEHFFNKKREGKNPGILEFSLEFNLQRVRAACILFLCLAGFSLPFVWKLSPIFPWGALPLFLLSLLGIACPLFHKRRPFGRPSLVKAAYLSFWGLICLSSIPYLAGDVLLWGAPVSATLTCCVLAAVPLLGRLQSALLFSLFSAGILAVTIGCNASPFFFLYSTLLNVGGFLLSWLSEKQYSALIQKISQENTTDYLTGILNRKGGMERMAALLDSCQKTGQSMGICMADIDNFKSYNDRYGHIQGDLALQQVSRALSCCLKDPEDFVCRFGGDEFLVCLSSAAERDFGESAQCLCAVVSKLGLPTADGTALSVSVGLTVCSPKEEGVKPTENDLIERADKALYMAKQDGRNRVRHYPQAENARI